MAFEANALGQFPTIAPTAYIHPTATLIGHILIGDRVFVGPNAVIRADEAGLHGTIEPIVIHESSNVQDGVIIHALGGTGVTIGPRTSIAHAAVIHGPCRIGARCFVGFHSVVFRATLQDKVIVLHQSLVESTELPESRLVPSMTAVRSDEEVHGLKTASEEMVSFAEKIINANVSFIESMRSRHSGLHGCTLRLDVDTQPPYVENPVLKTPEYSEHISIRQLHHAREPKLKIT